MQSIAIQDPSQVAEARRGAVTLARRLGFNEEDAGRAAIVVTELATNLIKHGGGGELLLAPCDHPCGSGLECIALDRGAGMEHPETCRQDGHSTTGTLGLGLGSIARGAHSLDIYSRPGLGTSVHVLLLPGRPGAATRQPEPPWGAVQLPIAGETACGDGLCVQPRDTGLRLLVVDGLGHGPLAAVAAHTAIGTFLANERQAPAGVLQAIHLALRPTRGAAVAIADIDLARGTVVFCGIGNVAGTLIGSDGSVRRMVSHNGIAGHSVKRVQEFSYTIIGTPLVVMCSDGVGTSWSLDAYPGLSQCHPALIASMLYRDFRRTRDDLTVLVARVR